MSKIRLLFIFILGIELAISRTGVNFPCSLPPTIDGTISGNEWRYADTVRLAVGNNRTINVFFMKDRDNLNFLFAGNLESRLLFPEILFNINNSASTTWETDDWWFHVSATDCENKGAYGVYSNCSLIHSDWVAEKNITQGNPITDTVEIAMPLNKIGLSSAGGYAIRLCFVASNTFNAWHTWPQGAIHTNPSTWAEFWVPVCELTSLGKENIQESNFMTLFPNPSQGVFKLKYRSGSGEHMFRPVNVTGEVLGQICVGNGINEIDLSAFKPGIYFLKAQLPMENYTSKRLL